MALSPVTVWDSFNRSVNDSWGVTDSGHGWLNTQNAKYDRTGGAGRVLVDPGDPTRIVYIAIPNQQSMEVLARWKVSSASASNQGPVLRYADASNFLYARLDVEADKIYIESRVNGVLTTVGNVTKTLASNVYYWVRFRASSTTAQIKVWADGTAEPGSWDLTSTVPTTYGSNFGWRTVADTTSYYLYLGVLYFYSLEDVEGALPVTDTFNRTISNGLGQSDTGHLWAGAFQDDPDYYALYRQGDVTTSGYGTLQTVDDSTARHGIIGPTVADGEVTTAVVSDVTGTFVDAVLRATDQASSGVFQFKGYIARLNYGSTSFSLRKLTTFGGTSTLIGSAFTLSAAPAAGEKWWIKIQAQGTTLKAKAWKDGTSEPAFQITQTDADLTSGRAILKAQGPSSGTANFQFHDFTYTVVTTVDTLTTGTLSTNTVTDTSFAIQATYTNDDNANSTCSIQYRVSGDDTWTGLSVTTDRVNRKFTASISGLTQGTIYEVKATYSDANGVSGTNPLTTTVTTTLKGIDASDLALVAGTTTIDVTAAYLNDTDSDSTAVVAYRSLGSTSTASSDSFTEVEGGHDLATHVGEINAVWVQNPIYTAGDLFVDDDGTVYTSASGQIHAYYTNAAPASADYDVQAKLIVKSLPETGALDTYVQSAGVALRMNSSAGTFYYGDYHSATGGWRIVKRVSGTPTTLGTYLQALAIDDEHTVRLSARGTTLTLFVDDVPRVSVTDNSISAAGQGGLVCYGLPPSGRGYVLDDFKLITYSASGSYGSDVAMTADHPNKVFTKQLTGLTPDTTYEVRVTFTDADGARGINPLIEVTTTLGTGVEPSTISVTPTDIAAYVVVTYLYDTNNNSSCAFQYRTIRSTRWVTASSSAVTIDRSGKQFRLILSGLTPNLTYEVRGIVSDPNGILSGADDTLSITFTTKGTITDGSQRGKYYIHKIYDPDGAFLGTWPDAPTPQFQWDENGGLTDLMVVLPRTLAALNVDATLDFGNRVDVWAIDGTSQGMGRNLIKDWDMDLGSWVLTTSWSVDATGGPDDGSCLKFSSTSTTLRQVHSENIALAQVVPLVVSCIARAQGGKLRVDLEAFNASDVSLGSSTDDAETVRSDWQVLTFEWTPPPGTAYVQVRAENSGKGVMRLDKVTVLAKEVLIYRGYIEDYEAIVEQDGERVEVEVLGPVAQLTDIYIDFLQYVEVQPTKDINEGRIKHDPTDPANMLKAVIDIMQDEDPRCDLYYTSDSIKLTGETQSYTFRNQQAVNCFDKIRGLCPPGWHWFIEADGKVNLRGPEHVNTHLLRLGIEILSFRNRKSIRNLKNFIHVKGRQDDDNSEPDGFGSIDYVAKDQESIDRYRLRMLYVRDANITTPETAETVGDGRLEEYNVPEQQVKALIPDEKEIKYSSSSLSGYNIEAFVPGDFIRVLDPVSGEGRTYWDRFFWDDATWDSYTNRVLPFDVPIKSIQHLGTQANLELSQRQPSATGDFAKLVRWMRTQEQDTGE